MTLGIVRPVPRNAALIPGDLIALHTNVGIGQIEDPAKLPTRMVVFPWGEHKTAKGSFNVNEVTLSALPANQALSNFDRVVLDFDHNTVPGSATYKGEPAAIAATARVVCLSGEGIVYEDIEWTAEGRQFIGGGHYRDISPAVKRDAKNNVIFLHSAAACRQGAVPGLILFSADQTNPTTTNTMPDFKKLLCAILDLDPEKATDEEIQTAAEKAANEEEVEEVKPDGDEKPTVESLSAKIVTLEGTVNKVLGASTSTERNQIITLASHEGKVIPAAALKLGNEDLRALVADLPVTVPLEKRTPAGASVVALSASGATGTDSIQAEVNSKLGLTKAVYDKHNS